MLEGALEGALGRLRALWGTSSSPVLCTALPPMFLQGNAGSGAHRRKAEEGGGLGLWAWGKERGLGKSGLDWTGVRAQWGLLNGGLPLSVLLS